MIATKNFQTTNGNSDGNQAMKRCMLTSHELSRNQKSVLKLGLNFLPAPTNLPLVDTIASIEGVAKKVRVANDLRGTVYEESQICEGQLNYSARNGKLRNSH